MAFRGRCGLPRGRNLRDDRPEGWSTASCRSTAGLLTRTTHGDLDEVVVEVGIDMEAMWFNVAADNSGAANPSRCATRISGTCTAPAALLPRLACHLPPRCPHAQPRSSSAVQAVTFRSTRCMSALLLLTPCVLRSLLHRVMHQPRSARCAQSW